MKRINKNFYKRKIYKLLPKKIQFKLLGYLLPELKPDVEDFILRAAVTPEDYLSAFNLVYKVFLKERFIQPRTKPFRLAPQHCHENARVFIGLLNKQGNENLVYSVSVFPDSDQGLPMDTVFDKELGRLRKCGRYLLEVGHLAVDPACRMNTMHIPMLGNKIVIQYAMEHLDADDIVIAIHPKFQWFYEELMLFEKLGAVEQYGYANNNPAVAMRLDLRRMRGMYKQFYRNIKKQYSFYEFFFNTDSKSIHLPESLEIEDRLVQKIKYVYKV